MTSMCDTVWMIFRADNGTIHGTAHYSPCFSPIIQETKKSDIYVCRHFAASYILTNLV